MDPLSDVLSLLKPRSHVSGGFDARGDWAIRFSRNVGIKCYSVVSGECWMTMDDVPGALHLNAGDSFVLPRGRPFGLASDLSVTPVDAGAIFPTPARGGVARFNGGGEFFLVGSRFEIAGHRADLLLEMLPPIVHIRNESDQAALRWSVERMMQELREPQPGNYLVAQHLAHMMLVQALRLHLADGAAAGGGWLIALADRQLSAALNAMHEDPARRWTLQELAGCAGMSRSTFALKFKATVGSSPMDYLTRWRMLLAGDRLENTGDPVSAVSLSLGYESESAFSTAFKRVMGCSPRQYGRTRSLAAETEAETEADAATQTVASA